MNTEEKHYLKKAIEFVNSKYCTMLQEEFPLAVLSVHNIYCVISKYYHYDDYFIRQGKPDISRFFKYLKMGYWDYPIITDLFDGKITKLEPTSIDIDRIRLSKRKLAEKTHTINNVSYRI